MKTLKLKKKPTKKTVRIGEMLDWEYNSPSSKEKGKLLHLKKDFCLESLVVLPIAWLFNCAQEQSLFTCNFEPNLENIV